MRREPGAVTVSLAAEKALAAARCRLLAERLTEADRDELIRSWTHALDEADAARSDAAAELVVIEFRDEIEARLSAIRPRVSVEEVG